MRDLIDNAAEQDDDEEDESFDEDTGEVRERKRDRRGNDMDDSSEEDEDDDDEEEARKVRTYRTQTSDSQWTTMDMANRHSATQIREGFIVEDEDEEEEDDDQGVSEKKKRKRKRRQERQEDAQLDEEDLDLIGETIPDWERKQQSQVRSLVYSFRLIMLTRAHRASTNV